MRVTLFAVTAIVLSIAPRPAAVADARVESHVKAVPRVTVVAAGDSFVVDFKAIGGWKILACGIGGEVEASCVPSEDGAFATAMVIVPPSTPPGALNLVWSAVDGVIGKPDRIPDAGGTFSVRVRPGEPQFTVTADHLSGRPGTQVTVSFVPLDHVTIESCSARLGSGPIDTCGEGRIVVVRVPAGAKAGLRNIAWTLAYSPVLTGQSGRAEGRITFRVLPPPIRPTTPSTTPSTSAPSTQESAVTPDADTASPEISITVSDEDPKSGFLIAGFLGAMLLGAVLVAKRVRRARRAQNPAPANHLTTQIIAENPVVYLRVSDTQPTRTMAVKIRTSTPVVTLTDPSDRTEHLK